MNKKYNKEHIGHMSDIIKNQPKLKNKLQAVSAQNTLEELLGDIIKEYINKIRVHEDKLHIYLNSSTLKHELYHQKPTLLERINESIHGDPISDIVFHG